MTRMLRAARFAVRRFAQDRGGATAIEYAIIAAGVGGTVATIVWTLGGTVRETYYDRLLSLF